MDIETLREKAELPAFTGAWAGTETSRGWPAAGIQIPGTQDVSLVCTHNGPLEQAIFSGFTHSRFHYCPQGKWEDWVKLAHNIIAVDGAIKSEG